MKRQRNVKIGDKTYKWRVRLERTDDYAAARQWVSRNVPEDRRHLDEWFTRREDAQAFTDWLVIQRLRRDIMNTARNISMLGFAVPTYVLPEALEKLVALRDHFHELRKIGETTRNIYALWARLGYDGEQQPELPKNLPDLEAHYERLRVKERLYA